MPGPGGPGPRGPMGGGPRGGGMPMGGGPTVYVNGQAYNRFAPVSGGKELAPTSGPVESIAIFKSNFKRSMKYSIARKGKGLSGILLGIRHGLTNNLHLGSFERKVALAQKAFEDNKISEQQMAVRKMRAAGDYYTYLKRIGFITDMELSSNMRVFANSIGVEYEDENLTQGRSR